MHSRLAALTAALSLAAPTAWAEAYKVNLHVAPAVGTDLSPPGLVSGADMKLDFKFISIGPVSPQLEAFGYGSGDNNLLVQGALFGGGIGLRWRILDDQKGYYFVPGGGPSGNLHGNLWLDAHLALSNGGPRVGFDVGVGYELSLVDGLQIGPYAKFVWLKESLMVFGLSFSIGGPAQPTETETADAATDDDHDGVKGAADKCPTQAEDHDGFEDDDGCPELDNDDDGIPDEQDKCRNEAEDKDGFQDDDGCPDPDNDLDGIPDGKDLCPLKPEDKNGVSDDDGCPDAEAPGAPAPASTPQP
ncbi:MAG: hypothetical protein IPJ65_25725 [Archangiaceae bacterium]|nr:hypothetical protein [Archangiaceae bacterium]